MVYALNYVYHTIDTDPELSKDAVIVLSEIMRFAVEASHGKGLISIGDEVAQVDKLIKLNKLRRVGNQVLDIYLEDRASGFLIVPLYPPYKLHI